MEEDVKMKKRTYKKYQTKKRGGQHYWINYGASPRFIKIKKKGKIIKTRPPGEVLKLARQLEKQLIPHSKRIELAGSIRRKKPAKDIDIVLIPRKDKKDDILRLIKKRGKIKAEGKKQIFANVKGVETDVFFSDRDSWGAQMLTRTGSAGHNIGLRQIAQQKGMLLNQYGLFKKGKKIAGKTERGIYEALGRPRFKPPEERN